MKGFWIPHQGTFARAFCKEWPIKGNCLKGQHENLPKIHGNKSSKCKPCNLYKMVQPPVRPEEKNTVETCQRSKIDFNATSFNATFYPPKQKNDPIPSQSLKQKKNRSRRKKNKKRQERSKAPVKCTQTFPSFHRSASNLPRRSCNLSSFTLAGPRLASKDDDVATGERWSWQNPCS